LVSSASERSETEGRALVGEGWRQRRKWRKKDEEAERRAGKKDEKKGRRKRRQRQRWIQNRE
jgi:hypothetical protein